MSSVTLEKVSWSSRLLSPQTAAFSPSKEPPPPPSTATSVHGGSSSSPASSLVGHGWGLQRCTEQARQYARTGQGLTELLQDVAHLEEQLAQALVKTAPNLVVVTANGGGSNGGGTGTGMHTMTNQGIAEEGDDDDSDSNHNNHNTSMSTATSVKKSVSTLHDSVLAWSGTTTRVSDVLRGTVAHKLRRFFLTHGETLTGIQERYTQCRQQCVHLRQQAQLARARYVKALREAEQAVAAAAAADADKAAEIKTGSNSSSNLLLQLPWRVVAKVRYAKQQEAEFKQCVQWENRHVEICQRLEIMALETMQNLQKDRTMLLTQSLLMGLETEAAQAAVDLPKLSSSSSHADDTAMGESGRPSTTAESKLDERDSREPDVESRGRKRFSKSFRSSSFSTNHSDNFEELERQANSNSSSSSGAMDAETLGLPEEFGSLRDQMRNQLWARSSRIRVALALSSFVEALAAALKKYGNTLQARVQEKETNAAAIAPGTSTPTPRSVTARSLQEEMEAHSEFARIADLWNSLCTLWSSKASESLTLASHLGALRQEKLSHWVEQGEKAVKSLMEQDDKLWKELCEASRNQMRADERYRQLTAHGDKLRQRVKSVDAVTDASSHGGIPAPASPARVSSASSATGGGALVAAAAGQGGARLQAAQQKVGKRVSKGLANVFSILPDGGEKALKILAPGTRASINQHSLDQADEKETKGRQVLEQAIEATAQAIERYKTHAQAVLSGFEQEEQTGWEDIQATTQTIFQHIETERKQIQEKAALSQEEMRPTTSEAVLEWMDAWCSKMQKEIERQASNGSPTSPDDVFALSPQIEQSSISSLLATVQTNSDEDPSNEDDAEEGNQDGSEAQQQQPPQEGRTRSDSDANAPATAAMEIPPSPTKWIVGSLNRPGGTVADFKRKLSRRKRQPLIPQGLEALSVETATFIAYLWPEDNVDTQTLPAIVDSFSCSVRESATVPSLYGRIFLSEVRFLVTSWTGKRVNVRWTDLTALEVGKSAFDENDDSFVVTGPSGDSVSVEGLVDFKTTLDLVKQLREKAKAAAPVSRQPMDVSNSSRGGSVPPDSTMKKMQVILSGKLHGVSVQSYYDIIWSEGCGTSAKPFYEPWLRKAAFDVELKDWEMKDVVGPWCGETYPQSRSVTFKVKRRTHLYIGPPIANVVQTHRCRVEGNDKCVASITTNFEGLPYADSFSVEQRWVARRDGESDLFLECGVFVDFKKHTILKGKISAGTTEETKPLANNFFKAVKLACTGETTAEAVEDVPEKAEVETEQVSLSSRLLAVPWTIAAIAGGILILLFLLTSYASPSKAALQTAEQTHLVIQLATRVQRIEADIESIHSKLDQILAILKHQGEVSQGEA